MGQLSPLLAQKDASLGWLGSRASEPQDSEVVRIDNDTETTGIGGVLRDRTSATFIG